MRILVTGAAGFIGSYIQDALIFKGHEVLSIDNLSGGFKRNFNDKAKVEVFNLCRLEEAEWAIGRFQPEVVFHCAANAREGASFFDPAKIVFANQVTAVNTMEASIKAGSLKKFIYFSSMAAYGDQEPPFVENMTMKPCDVYGIAKYSMEETLKLLADCHGFKYTIIRPHNVFGARQSIKDIYRNVIGIFMNRIMRKEYLYIYGDGQQKRQFSYIQDSLPAFLSCIDKADNDVVNIGGINTYTVEEVAFAIIKAMGYDTWPIYYTPERYKEVKFAYCNPQKSIDLLGYKENYTVEQGIQTMATWAKLIGPQEWSNEKLSIPNERIPETWRD